MDADTVAPRGSPIPAEEIVVVYGVDNRFALPLAASIQSALEHLGSGYRLDIRVIDGGLSLRNRARLTRSFVNKPCSLVWLTPGHGKYGSLKVGGTITIATYYRLLIAELLPTLRKAIYLDADVIVQGDLAELWALPIGNQHVLAVQDQGVRSVSGPYGLKNFRVLGIPEGTKYFNAGVLVLNLDRWRSDNTAATIIDYISRNDEHIRFWDQDGLNAILWRSWGEIDPRWNQMRQILQVTNLGDSPFTPDVHKEVVERPYIIHYSSPDKPWRFGCRHPAANLFFEALDRTEYRGYRPARWRMYIDDAVDFFRKRITKLFRVARARRR